MTLWYVKIVPDKVDFKLEFFTLPLLLYFDRGWLFLVSVTLS